MKRNDICIPKSSLLLRELSLLSAVLYFFAFTIPSLNIIISIIIFLCIFNIIASIVLDRELRKCYKLFIISVLMAMYFFVLYGLFWGETYAQINSLITKVGLCLACGGLLLYGLVGLFLSKHNSDVRNGNKEKIHFVDLSCIMVLLVTILANL